MARAIFYTHQTSGVCACVYVCNHTHQKENTCVCKNGRYPKCVVNDSKLVWDGTIHVKDIVSTKMTNTIATNITSTAPINFHSEKVRYKIDCCILDPVLLVILLLLVFTTICYHYAKHRSKQKVTDALTMYKWRTMNFRKFVLKIVRVIISIT